jgi:acetaldehyde dehydrogenase (acetylating)
MVGPLKIYVPGYRLKQEVQFEDVTDFLGAGTQNLTKVSIFRKSKAPATTCQHTRGTSIS